ncbi:uncharacterized protein LOC6564264 isoform X1 [Drosophila grimshawi]|nr:uncharacterized protein LOC6564264 isoform X1 [Drosophila grimshawi]XP_043070860.1 uncharacterized protein LOC6564264 isoform X1 [Drosophila grimshawi]
MLREASLPQQMQLDMAMSQLNGYATVLKSLKQMLQSGCEVPQDIWLKDVICLANEHMEKMPTQVHVTKSSNNPYQFRCTMDNISTIFETHFECKFVDPQIEVRFYNEYDRQSVILDYNSALSSFGNNCWPGQRTKTISARGKQQMRVPPNNIKESISLMNISWGSERNAQQPEFVQTFSGIDISRGNESAANAMAVARHHVGDWFRTDAHVYVRTIKSPEDFYVQCIRAAHCIREQLAAFAQSDACRPPSVIVVGQQYITCHSHSEMHRALVSQKADQRDNYHVFLPDIGLNCEVHYSKFLELPECLANLPFAAVHCSLKQLMPSDGCDWKPEAGAFLKQLVKNFPVQITVLRILGPELYEIDLITKNYESKISVRESFLYTGLARASEDYATALIPRPLPLIALQSQRLPQFLPRVGDVLKVQMLHIQHPQEFYVMPHELERKRCEMQQKLQCFMDRMSLTRLEPIYLGRLHLGCVVQLDGEWHRGCIVEMLPKGFVAVRLVDIGVSHKLYWGNLFVLPKEFWCKELAIKCRLADVETLQEHNYTWTPSAIAAFKQITSNPQLQLEVTFMADEVTHVALHHTRSSGGDSINVAAVLIDQNHCQSNGESSKVRQPLLQRQSQLDADMLNLIQQSKGYLEQPLPVKTDSKLNRSAIQVLHVQHPNEFYVTLAHFMPAIADLRQTVQAAAEEMYEMCSPKTVWQPGEMCYVNTRAYADFEPLWHRGEIVSSNGDDYLKYNVRLRDIGELALGLRGSSLVIMDEHLGRVSNSAIRCDLYGIAPNGDKWSPEAIEFFKTQLQAYSSLKVSGHGREGDSLMVTLWGASTEISGPFSPARITYTSINAALVQAGWAVSYHNKQSLDISSTLTAGTGSNGTLSEDPNSDDEKILIEKYNKFSERNRSQQDALPNLGLEHYDEMLPPELLYDLNISAFIGCTKAPPAWLQPRECNKSLFTAMPTYVNYNCEIYLSLTSDAPFMHKMRRLMLDHFKPMLKHLDPTTYVVGQPVVAIYHLDNFFYRGIVISEQNALGEHKVYYVDYGNEELVLPSEMVPFAPFPHVNAMCWPITIHGVQPIQNKYTLKAIDIVHRSVVMKLSNVRVVQAKGINGLPQCQIKVCDMDISTMMVNNKLAAPLQQKDEQLIKQQKRENALQSFKLFDELLELGRMKPKAKVVAAQNNTMAQPPPAKKKYLMNSKEMKKYLMNSTAMMQQMEYEEDFDCKDAAKQQLQTSVNFENDGSDNDDENDNNEEETLADGFSDDNTIESDEGIANEDDENITVPDLDPALNQLRHSFQLRCKEMSGSAHFSPMDTSTQHSYNDSIDGIKPQCLPTGVNSFPCSIDKVLSALELQISPQITEFSKQKMALARETSALITDAAQLVPVRVDALCLARYTLDNKWYRAIVKELHQINQKATVCYIDFPDIEMVPYVDLKVMPKQLFMFPLRSFHVKLHGVKLNTKYTDSFARSKLQQYLYHYPTVFACVHYPLVRHGNMFEIDLFEDKYKKELIYQPLIDSRIYLPHNS